jgi:dethiobiotin synthetase
MGKSIFVSGIDTDAGKTYCTAWLAMHLAKQGYSVITQKFIQTGNVGSSEDIEAHRRLMGMDLTIEDREGLTAPVIFSYPASAQLAARIDNAVIDLSVIDDARAELEKRYDIVLVEGAGGLMVPITDDFLAIDYIVTRGLPVALVTNSRLGSINHTLLSLDAIRHRDIKLDCVLYNTFFDVDTLIAEDTRAFIQRHMCRHYPDTPIYDVPSMAKH